MTTTERAMIADELAKALKNCLRVIDYDGALDADPQRIVMDGHTVLARYEASKQSEKPTQPQSEVPGWLPIETAPKDRVIEVYAPPTHGLNAMVSLCEWHEDAGFCICELREPTHWRPHTPPREIAAAQYTALDEDGKQIPVSKR